jgi:hypothetical protein
MSKGVYIAYTVIVVLMATAIMQAYDRDDPRSRSGYSSSGSSRGSWSGGAPRSK